MRLTRATMSLDKTMTDTNAHCYLNKNRIKSFFRTHTCTYINSYSIVSSSHTKKAKISYLTHIREQTPTSTNRYHIGNCSHYITLQRGKMLILIETNSAKEKKIILKCTVYLVIFWYYLLCLSNRKILKTQKLYPVYFSVRNFKNRKKKCFTFSYFRCAARKKNPWIYSI